MNGAQRERSGKNPGFLRFFKFGTPVAKHWSTRMTGGKQTKVQGDYPMSILENASSRALAAVFAFGVSAMFMAAAIVPASPAGLIA